VAAQAERTARQSHANSIRTTNAPTLARGGVVRGSVPTLRGSAVGTEVPDSCGAAEGYGKQPGRVLHRKRWTRIAHAMSLLRMERGVAGMPQLTADLRVWCERVAMFVRCSAKGRTKEVFQVPRELGLGAAKLAVGGEFSSPWGLQRLPTSRDVICVIRETLVGLRNEVHLALGRGIHHSKS
jgi:hypothetical protein